MIFGIFTRCVYVPLMKTWASLMIHSFSESGSILRYALPTSKLSITGFLGSLKSVFSTFEELPNIKVIVELVEKGLPSPLSSRHLNSLPWHPEKPKKTLWFFLRALAPAEMELNYDPNKASLKFTKAISSMKVESDKTKAKIPDEVSLGLRWWLYLMCEYTSS